MKINQGFSIYYASECWVAPVVNHPVFENWLDQYWTDDKQNRENKSTSRGWWNILFIFRSCLVFHRWCLWTCHNRFDRSKSITLFDINIMMFICLQFNFSRIRGRFIANLFSTSIQWLIIICRRKWILFTIRLYDSNSWKNGEKRTSWNQPCGRRYPACCIRHMKRCIGFTPYRIVSPIIPGVIKIGLAGMLKWFSID